MRPALGKNKISEAVILAGGKGTRLGPLVESIPKPMLQVAGKAFLEYILDELIVPGIEQIILSVGYKKEAIQDHFSECYRDMQIRYCVEDSPRGTGGAIKEALKLTSSENIVICNGDSFFPVDIRSMFDFHKEKKSLCTVAVKYMDNCSRYGVVGVTAGKINKFSEKKSGQSGLINGGIYILNRRIADHFPSDDTFSFEKDVLEKLSGTDSLTAFESKEFFIDIGVPEDFERAQQIFKEKI